MERRLGRGLGALLGGDLPDLPGNPEAPGGKDIATVEISRIDPNPDQPRKVFSSEAMESLRESIKQHGLMQPVCVRPSGTRFRIVAGERRWRAARLAGLHEIPVRIMEKVDENLALELALVENLQREDLNPIEKAKAYRDLVDRVGLTQEQVAQRVGLKRTTVTNHLRLLELPKDAQEAVVAGLITMGHARALLGAPDSDQIPGLLAQVVRRELSVRQTEELVRAKTGQGDSAQTADSGTPQAAATPVWVRELEGRFRDAMGTKVTLHNRSGFKGQIVVHYHDRDELERLTEALAPKDRL